MPLNMLSVETRWIDWDGADGDPKSLFDRSGDSVADFLLHTLGWIRITQIGQSYDVTFDPRSVRESATTALVDWVEQLDRDADTVWLMRVSAYTGRDWIEFTGTTGEQVLPFLNRLLQFGFTPEIPTAITTTTKTFAEAGSLGDDVVRAIGRLRWSGGTLSIRDSAVQALLKRRKEGSAVKILSRDSRKRVVVGAYTPSTTSLWQESHVANFVGTPVVEAMPDRGLGAAVARSAERTIETREPQFETWEGPVLSSDGRIVELKWDRLTLPLSNAGSGDAVLVVSQRITPFRVRSGAHHAYGGAARAS